MYKYMVVATLENKVNVGKLGDLELVVNMKETLSIVKLTAEKEEADKTIAAFHNDRRVSAVHVYENFECTYGVLQ